MVHFRGSNASAAPYIETVRSEPFPAVRSRPQSAQNDVHGANMGMVSLLHIMDVAQYLRGSLFFCGIDLRKFDRLVLYTRGHLALRGVVAARFLAFVCPQTQNTNPPRYT